MLEMSIDIAAKPSTVYRFLSEPKLFQQWFPGGEAARGAIREAVPDQRIAFSLGSDSVVTIELVGTADNGTNVKLSHEGLDAQQQAEHSKGWTYHLSQLARHAGSLDAAEGLPLMIDAYCFAWNETSAPARREMLARCWEPDAAFRDGMGTADGLDALDRYIGKAQQFLPGFRLEAAGKPDLVHGYVRFPWVIRTPDGSVMMRGTNFGQLSAGGKFRFITGFGDAP